MTTNIQKWGNSQGVRIPKIILELLEWKDNEELSISTECDKIIIQKAKSPLTLSDVFKDYNEDYKPETINWGEPVGGEIW